MNRLQLYILGITLLLSAFAIGQEVIVLEGQVLNDTISKSGLTVVNLSLKKGVITNDNGRFEILARINDTIHISAVQYEPRQFVISETIYNRAYISLYLVPKVTELDEVIISNIELTGDIMKDVMSTPLKKRITSRSLGIKENAHPTFTPEERRVYSATTGAGGSGSLINAISGRTKMLKKHLEISQLQAKVYAVKDAFSDKLYMLELKIPEDLIEDFVYYTFEDKDAQQYVDEGNALGLLDFMIQKSKTYRKLKEQEKQ